MTRNHEKQPYALAGLASVHRAAMRQTPLDWARSIHSQWKSGEMRPRKEVADAEKIMPKLRSSMKPALFETALKTIAREENELRLRALIRAIRLLGASKDARDHKLSAEILKGLELGWGIKRAYEIVSEGESELYDQLREQWGEVQLPPAGATVALYDADVLLVRAAVRGLK
jgi:hypothetical protein